MIMTTCAVLHVYYRSIAATSVLGSQPGTKRNPQESTWALSCQANILSAHIQVDTLHKANSKMFLAIQEVEARRMRSREVWYTVRSMLI